LCLVPFRSPRSCTALGFGALLVLSKFESPPPPLARSRTCSGDPFWSRFWAAPARVRRPRREELKLPAVVVHPPALVLVEHLERRAAVLGDPLRLASATERDRDERVARRVELARPRARGAQCSVPAQFDEAFGIERQSRRRGEHERLGRDVQRLRR